RGSSGGKKEYHKKFAWTRKKPYKGTGCKCRLRITVYEDRVAGRYTPGHNHSLGKENARFTSISDTTRTQIEAMLRSGISVANVLRNLHNRAFDEENRSQLFTEQGSRNHFITRADVRRIEKTIEQETIRLAKGDGESVLLWAERLRKEGHYVSLKATSDAPPEGSGIEGSAFVLIIQTQYQAECWEKHGGRFAGIDATHNTT
ncbi:hypothetical protein DFP72DRAFT_747881, partial [Ephemerocybe angulata]